MQNNTNFNMNNTQTNIWNLIKKDIKENENLENILNSLTNKENDIDKSTRGFFYERLWDICIKLGISDLTLKPTDIQFTTHFFGNSNNDMINHNIHFWKEYGGLKKYLLENIRSGSSGGYSDITFLNKIDEQELLNLISVKYYEDSKSIDCYDVDKLCALCEKHKSENRKSVISLFVKNKEECIKKFDSQHLSSNILLDYVNPDGNYENVYDILDLHKNYFKLRKLLSQYNYFESDEDIHRFEISYLNIIKHPFIPRFHQKLFIDKVIDLIIHKQINDILVGAIPRSGKSYIMAGIILEYIINYNKTNPDGEKLNFVMITPAPNETFSEYTDIFENHIDYHNNDIEYKIFNKNNDFKSLNKDKHNVIIVSKQKLGWSEPGKEGEEKSEIIEKKIMKMFGDIINNIELMLLDEAHFGMSTTKSMEIFNILQKFNKIPKVYVTATYNKPLQIWGITEDCKLTWDINDINIMKNINEITIHDNPIKQRFGEDIYNKTLKWMNINNIQMIENLKNEYSIYPKPHLITSMWHSNQLNIEKIKIGETNYGFDMNKLFMTKNKSFENIEQVTEMLRYYFGISPSDMHYNEAKFYKRDGIIPRIKNICSGKCRTMQAGHVTTQLWFLPVGQGELNDKISALLELLLNPEFKKLNYHYYTYVDNKKGLSKDKYVTYMNNPHNIKKEIMETEDKIRKGLVRGKNLIILTGNRLQLGISLKNVDIVVMWNSISSTDAIFQMLFRSMTEVGETSDNLRKIYGFMVDLNPQRAMTNVNLFSENITYNKSDKSDEYRQIIDLIDIDGDIIHSNENNEQEIINELFNKLYESWDKDVEGIKKITENFTYSPSMLSMIEKSLRTIKLSKAARELVSESEEKLDKGKSKEKKNDKSSKDAKKEIDEIDKIPIEKLAAELIAELISILNIFTLYLDSKTNCILLDGIKIDQNINIISDIHKLKDIIFAKPIEKTNFLKILNGRLNGDENIEYPQKVIDVILKSIVNKKDISYMEKIIFSQKKQYYGITDPEKLLEDINKNLAPKPKERKEAGEVFTSINLVREMLQQLPKDLWRDPTLLWLDPAVGIGNFPIIIYLNLMEGLKNPIKNVKYPERMKNIDISNIENRRKHILENMIYMIDISEKNLYILNKVFCGKNDDNPDGYSLNIYHKSFIQNENYEVFDEKIQFDIGVGNPPYQGTGTKKIYLTFIDKLLKNYLVNNGYLLFLTPRNTLKYLLGRNINEHTIDQLYNIIYFNSSDNIKSNYFKTIGSDFSYYLVQKSPYGKNTKIIFNNNEETEITLKWKHEINLQSNDQTSIGIINKVLAFDDKSIKTWYRSASRIEDKKDKNGNITQHQFDEYSEEHPHKIVVKILTDADKVKSGDDVIYKWTDVTKENTFKYKVLYPTLGNNPKIDTEQNLYPGTSFVPYVLCDSLNECNFIVQFTKSKLIKYIDENYPTRNIVDISLKNLIKKDKIIGSTINDKVIYDYFDITEDEIKIIEKKYQSTFNIDDEIKNIRNKIISYKLQKYDSEDTNYKNMEEYILNIFDNDIENLNSMTENEFKSYTKMQYIDGLKNKKKICEQKLALERKNRRENINFNQPIETDPKYIDKYKKTIENGNLWNIYTKRPMKNTIKNKEKLLKLLESNN